MGAVIEGLVEQHGPHATAQVLDAFKDLGFHFASQAGITISKNDVVIPPTKEKILERYEGEVGEILDQYDTGLISQEERHEAVVEKWNAATDEVGQAMQDNLHELNPIFMMANSGARGSFKQIRQLAGMRGLMANPKGEIIERPIKANFMEGLTVLEYFISTHGARKGLADTALRTADSGYLTRRLVDVAQDVIVRQEDCGTKEYIEMPHARRRRPAQRATCSGRFTAAEVKTKRSRSLLPKDHLVTKQDIEVLAEGLEEDDAIVPMRSVLKCEADTGICQHCYGLAPATGKLVAIGDAVGIIAAQSIGEPGTQLTLRTFHTGGVAGPGHHPGPPARGGAVRGAQAEGPGQAGRGGRQGVDRAHREGAQGDRHRRRGRGARVLVPGPDAAVRGRRARRSRRATSSTRARSTRTSCWTSAAARTPRCTSSRRSRRSTAHRAWTSRTSTSRSSSGR